ncbi:MAG: indole-3-glycerol phosphate synthase TrpC [Lachnospiraceae bacterium]|nr:indole-3-glycerol phosphate synthase TrpC [Lachnospiraceae bacterium]
MGNILDEIADKTRIRVAHLKEEHSLEEVKEEAYKKQIGADFPFEKALKQKEITFICEVKKASPSKGVIADEFPYVQIAKEYEEAGAGAISVLTEPEYFLGSDSYLKEIAKEVTIPILRKDFTVDAYQIYEAKVIGASAVLLICAILDDEQLKEYIIIAQELGLSALVEAHDEEEVRRAVVAGARIIGVNNRDLKTFTVDINNSVKLRKLVPAKILFVSESGIKRPQDVAVLKENSTDGVLIGETFMRSPDKKQVLKELKG